MANTWVEKVALLPSGFEPATLPAALQEQIQQALFGRALNQAGAKLGEDGMLKAGIAEVQAESVFSSQPITNSVRGLPIGQAFHKLEHRHQRQAPWG